MSEVDLTSMTKKQLEAYGRTVGVELDRRANKATLLDALSAHIEKVEDTTVEDVQVSVPVINPEIAAAKEMLAKKAEESARMVERRAEMHSADIEHRAAEQASRDAQRVAAQGTEASNQADATAKVLVDQAAVMNRMADAAVQHAASLLTADENPRDKELARQAEDAARVLTARVVVAQRVAAEATDRATLLSQGLQATVVGVSLAVKRESNAKAKVDSFL